MAIHPAKGEDASDNVLPNLLLDVREGFLGAFRPAFRQFGVTDQQYRVLSILHRNGDLEISRLARHARIVAPSMTGILDRMTETGWVTRKALPGQRYGVIALTAAGRRLIARLQPAADRRFGAFEAALGRQQLAQLGELLRSARDVLRAMNANHVESATTDARRASGRRTTRRRQGTRARFPGSVSSSTALWRQK